MTQTLLEVRHLKKYFPVSKGLLFARVGGWVKAVDCIDFSIERGETFGLIGESGCGKTTTAKLILLLEKATSGEVLFKGKDIQKSSGGALREYRVAVQPVFQDPYASLDPRERVRSIVSEPLEVQNAMSRKAIKERVAQVLEYVGLGARAADLYPHEFSGGQRQRIAIARALATNPQLIVLDEPVSALDVSIRAQVMNLLKDIQQSLGITYLLIAHDLAVIRFMSTTIGVMYLGKIVELGKSKEIIANPLHPYTEALLSAALPCHPDLQREEVILPGEVSSPLNVPNGCRFHPRCVRAEPACSEVEPALREVSPGHHIACHRSR